MQQATPQPVREISDLPGPPGLPLLGNAHQFRPNDFHQVIEDWAAEFGPLCALKIGPRQGVIVSDPVLIAEALKDRPHRFRRLMAMQEIAEELGINGLFSAEGDDWKRQRRAWMHALSIHQVKPFFDQITRVTERLLRRWQRAADNGDVVDVQADLMRYTVDVTTLFSFGVDSNTLEQEGDLIQEHLARVFHMLNRRLAMPVPYWRWFRLPADRRLDASMRVIRDYVNGIIADARARIAASPELAERPTNLLEALLVARDEDGSTFSDREIFGNTLTALLAGEDTTANTLAWMIHLLTLNPERQQELQGQVDAVLPDADLWRDLDDGERLVCVDAVMSETLRIKPVAPLVFLCANEDTTLGGVHIPAGTDVIMSMRNAALDPALNRDPLVFDPSRWDADQKKYATRPPMPFGGGPRMCPGRSLAVMEIKSVTSMIAKSFTIEPADATPVTEKMAFTLMPENLRVRFSRRSSD